MLQSMTRMVLWSEDSSPDALSSTGLRRAAYALCTAHHASIIYKAAGNLRAVQILIRHAKIESTAATPGVSIKDALEPAKRTEIGLVR